MMKLNWKTVTIIVQCLVIMWLLYPRMSFASETEAPPAAAAPASTCLPQSFPIADLCPADHPRTGDMTPDGKKFCCQ
jgi:hypothetical protein